MPVACARHGVANAAFFQNPPRLGEKIRKQLVGGRERVRPPRIVAASMPMIVLVLGWTKARTQRRRSVGVVKADKPLPIGVVQREGVAQSVGTLRRRLHAGNLEFEPVALFEVVHASIERQKKFKRVLVGYGTPSLYIISG